MNGVFQTGGVIGSLILPWISDKWGRKWGIAVVGGVLAEEFQVVANVSE
jgi:MFS family permease